MEELCGPRSFVPRIGAALPLRHIFFRKVFFTWQLADHSLPGHLTPLRHRDHRRTTKARVQARQADTSSRQAQGPRSSGRRIVCGVSKGLLDTTDGNSPRVSIGFLPQGRLSLLTTLPGPSNQSILLSFPDAT